MDYKHSSHSKGTVQFNKKSTLDWNKIEPLLTQVQNETSSKYVAFYSVSDSSEGTYYYATSALSFSPKAVKRAQGRIQRWFFESSQAQQEPTQLLAAYIPDSKLAEKEMRRWILAKTANKQTVYKTAEQINTVEKSSKRVASGCAKYFIPDTKYIFYDEDGNIITVIVVGDYETHCGGPPDDSDGGADGPPTPDVPCKNQPLPTADCGGCKDSSPPDQFCPGPGGGGTNVPPCEQANPPDYCTFVEPCETGNPAIDNISTKPKMADLFKESYGTKENPLPDDQRNEGMAFVIKNGDSYSLQVIESDPQGTNMMDFSASNVTIPNNTVAILHVHPAKPGERITDSRFLSDHNINEARELVPTYNADEVSPGDKKFMKSSNLPMYVMDAEKIRKIKPANPGKYSKEIERCGY